MMSFQGREVGRPRGRSWRMMLSSVLFLVGLILTGFVFGETATIEGNRPRVLEWSDRPKADEKVAVDLPIGVWKDPQGGAVLESVAMPAAHPASATGPGLHLRANKAGFVYTQAGSLPEGLEKMQDFSFWVYREDGQSPASVIEVRFFEKGGRASFWRKVTLDKPGWSEVIIPLATMRWGPKGVPSWPQVRQFGIYSRDPVDVVLAGFCFLRGGEGADLSLGALRRLAFPDPAVRVEVLEDEDLCLLTDQRGVDPEVMADWVRKHRKVLQRDFPFLQETPVRKPSLIVFADPADYRRFPVTFAAAHQSESAEPRSQGFTFMGIATSSWSSDYGAERPVFGHEFVHAWLELAVGLHSGSGDWVQEGLANYVQLEVTPQKNLSKIVLKGLSNPRARLPLEKLCSGARVPVDRYWQALTMMAFLKARYPDQLPQLFSAMQQTRDTNLGKHLNLLKTDWPTLTREWMDWCRENYSQSSPSIPEEAEPAADLQEAA